MASAEIAVAEMTMARKTRRITASDTWLVGEYNKRLGLHGSFPGAECFIPAKAAGSCCDDVRSETTAPPPPKLAPPGAGLPFMELLVTRYWVLPRTYRSM